MESDPKTISFSKNGEDLGVAFELTEDLEGKALHPNILIKNAEFSVNFGSQVRISSIRSIFEILKILYAGSFEDCVKLIKDNDLHVLEQYSVYSYTI